MNYHYMLCVRAVKNGKFSAEPGPSRYLKIPAGQLPKPEHAIARNVWVKEIIQAAKDRGAPAHQDDQDHCGDILIFVHGYNNDLEIINQRHFQLEADLNKQNFGAVVVTFCWPSDNKAINYLEDRHDAKIAAMQLVSDGIRLISAFQAPDCSINIHVIGHSTGAYVIREAFDDADDTTMPNNAWSVSQIIYIAADVSSDSMGEGNSTTDSLFRHCYRLSNYFSKYDKALKLSNSKRVGRAPRVGRIGLPNNPPKKAVDIDCSEYFNLLDNDKAIKSKDQSRELGSFDHSWHIGNAIFTKDLIATLKGDLDRAVIPTRKINDAGKFILTRPKG